MPCRPSRIFNVSVFSLVYGCFWIACSLLLFTGAGCVLVIGREELFDVWWKSDLRYVVYSEGVLEFRRHKLTFKSCQNLVKSGKSLTLKLAEIDYFLVKFCNLATFSSCSFPVAIFWCLVNSLVVKQIRLRNSDF